jgi:steroid delta-isomerase-like uncharacterized protein
MADHREIARRILETFNTGDFDAIEGTIKPDCIMHDPQSSSTDQRGMDVIRSQISLYRGAFPDLAMTVDAQYEDGDVLISRWTATGTHTGDLPMLPATGRRSTVTGIAIDRFEGDQIAESWNNWDTLGMLQQLGAIPAPDTAS